MRNLRFRHAARTSALGTAALIAALSLTACQSGGPESADGSGGSESQASAAGTSAAPVADRSKDEATDKAGTTAEDTGTTGSGSGTAKDSGSATSKPAAKPAGAQRGSGGAKDGALPTCTGANTELTMTSVQRPVNHMLLTVTNTGSKSCYAYSYPFLRFGEAQSVPQVVEDSVPQSVVVLAPGESAYTGVRTSSADGSGTGGYSTKELTVGLQGRDGGSEGPMVNVPLGKEVYVDSTLAVTYWRTDMDDALMY
ncbi:DUF4232 domain-containing protein [Streptomyces sp. NPDC102402]|uniref:DUF4232 domain-containing protein n=1 Tax=Streptomyces sp. NPDC102402 TaxID=3366169 RepID=UPI003820CF88